MNIRLGVVDRDGGEHLLETSPAGTLMEVLRDLDGGVAALCGGMCSCGSCHVYVADEWREKVPAAQSDERAMLEELEFKRPHSRLSCRIELSGELDGLHVSLAPEE